MEGDEVVEGDEIGKVGNTGNAQGTIPHLHFGVYENGWFSRSTIDPLPLMP
jgi:murein DD-endopeptidase MepM/ murein hydrolase activator NlpD